MEVKLGDVVVVALGKLSKQVCAPNIPGKKKKREEEEEREEKKKKKMDEEKLVVWELSMRDSTDQKKIFESSETTAVPAATNVVSALTSQHSKSLCFFGALKLSATSEVLRSHNLTSPSFAQVHNRC